MNNNNKHEVWLVRKIGGSKEDYKLFVEAAKNAGLDFKTKNGPFFFLVGKVLFCKGLPVIKRPKLVLSRIRSKGLRKWLSFNPDIIAINENKTYEVVGNKFNCHTELEKHNILQPNFLKPTKQSTYKEVSDMLGSKFVIKDVMGNKGSKVFLVNNEDEYKHAIRRCRLKRAMCQEFINFSHGKDLRVIIMGGKIIVAFIRKSQGEDFRANISQGGTATFVQLTPEQEDHALRVYNALGGGFLSVDFLFGANDELIFCESNVHTALRMRYDYKTHNINVAASLVEYIQSRLESN